MTGSTATAPARTVAQELAGWALGLRLADIPSAVREAAGRHLLDGLGTAIAAARSGAAAPAVTVALGLGGPPEATILGTGARVSAPAAALANGTLIHALDFDDTHAGGLVHATSVVASAALAVGEQTGASGADVTCALVAGYETMCRVAGAAPHAFHAQGLHATMVAGVFGAAIVAARLLRLSVAQAVDALGIAGSQAGGLLEFLTTGASTKQLHPGFAAQAGILAARLAAAGASGPATVLEGPRGLYAALSAHDVDAAVVVAGLGQRWETTQITIKPYPTCQLAHVSIDAAQVAYASAGRPDLADVVEIVADVHPDSAAVVCEPVVDKIRPSTPYAAKFSLQWSVAAALIDGQITVDTYLPSSLARPAVAELAERVAYVVPAISGPSTSAGSVVAADAAGRVTLRLRDGATVVGEVARSLGGPDRPLDDATLTAKYRANAGSADAEATDDLARRVRELANEPDLAALVAVADRLGTQERT